VTSLPGARAAEAIDKSLLVLFFRKEQERKTLLFLKKKKQKDFYSVELTRPGKST
jgi:hypothetical protein